MELRSSAQGGTVLNPSQTLDHHHHQFHQQLNLHQTHVQVRDPNQNQDRDPSPSPAPAPPPLPNAIGSASNSRTPPPPPQPQPASLAAAANSIQYRECLKNHAAATGGYVTDGCGEFMPGGEEGTVEALKCAACDCHRSFHRRDAEGGEAAQVQSLIANSHFYPYNNNNHPNINNTTNHRTSTTPHLHHPPLPPPPPHHHRYSHHHGPVPPMMVAFGGGSSGAGAGAESSSEDLNMFHHHTDVGILGTQQTRTKKRFRTRFSQGQKERMQEFAERLGWRIQRQDDQQVDQFCGEVGVKRQVFKVWMHNNKAAMKKKQL